jgi:uncharacterized membrane protein
VKDLKGRRVLNVQHGAIQIPTFGYLLLLLFFAHSTSHLSRIHHQSLVRGDMEERREGGRESGEEGGGLL